MGSGTGRVRAASRHPPLRLTLSTISYHSLSAASALAFGSSSSMGATFRGPAMTVVGLADAAAFAFAPDPARRAGFDDVGVASEHPHGVWGGSRRDSRIGASWSHHFS